MIFKFAKFDFLLKFAHTESLKNQKITKTMNNWIKSTTRLIGETVDLIPLNKSHFAELEAIAKDTRIWEFYSYDCSQSEKFINLYTTALISRDKGCEFPFVVVHKKDNKIIGSTRFLDIQEKNLKLEIGWTWLHPNYWASEVNLECKLLMLTYCFEVLKTNRVQIKTDATNIRSRKAIEKIGGQLEGILRKDMIRDNGTIRNSAYFSIIDDEWEENKKRLAELYQSKKMKNIYKTNEN